MIFLRAQLTIQELVKDFGPIYRETQVENFKNIIVEPWNAFSSLIFLIPVVIVLIKLKKEYKAYPFLVYWAAPLLAIGGIGSTLYHAFRSHPGLLIMDFAPIALLSLSIAFFFLNRLLRRWWLSVLIIVAIMFLRTLAFQFYDGTNHQTPINIAYFLTGVMVGVPIIIFLIKSKFAKIKIFLFTIFLFAISLFFRSADDWIIDFMPMGTHWLWHFFSAAGALTMGIYIYSIYNIKFEKKK